MGDAAAQQVMSTGPSSARLESEIKYWVDGDGVIIVLDSNSVMPNAKGKKHLQKRLHLELPEFED